MNKANANLIIDAGNTRVKVVEVQGDELKVLETLSFEAIKQAGDGKKYHSYVKSLLSSVLSLQDTEVLKEYFRPNHVLSSASKFPFHNNYKSETLGADRAANAAFAFSETKKRNTAVLVIDLGTCVKFDFVNVKGEYLGGSISPGLQMRYKAMHHFTGRLPLLKNVEKVKLVGDSTEKSMWSGVINGMHAEIRGMLKEYENQYGALTTFMTGGDAKLFDIEAKNYIFVNENLTLQGLNIILEHNAK